MAKTKTKSIDDPIPKDIFDILACPLCRADLEYTKDKKQLVCSKCGAKYKIEGNVPILLPRKHKQ